MKPLQLAAACLAITLLTSAPQSRGASSDAPPARTVKPPAKESCPPSCLVMRVSTRCACRLGKTLPAVAST
jgi:hypothetical protein